MAEDTIFAKIARGEIQADVVYQDNEYCAFRDIHPAAPIHFLVVPIEPIPDILSDAGQNERVIAGLVLAANRIVRKFNLEMTGFRYVINYGRDGGQEVPHVHLHILAGRQLGWPPG